MSINSIHDKIVHILFIFLMAFGLVVSFQQFEGDIFSFPALRILFCGVGLIFFAVKQSSWIWLARAYLFLLLLGNTIILLRLLVQYIDSEVEPGEWLVAIISALEWGVAFVLLQWKPGGSK